MKKMKLDEARELLSGFNKFEASNRNDQKPGRALQLIERVELLKTQEFKPMVKVSTTVLVPIRDESGKAPGDTGYAGHMKGDRADFVFFYNRTFARFFSPFICAALNMPASEAAGLTGEEVQKLALSVMQCDGQATGVLDGTVVLDITAETSAPYPDKKKPGSLTTSVNTNGFEHVPLASLAEHLNEKDIAKFFGSEERFMELVAAEESEG